MASTVRQIAYGSAWMNRPQAAGSVRTLGSAWQAGTQGSWWSQHREASLNWLALGMLLAAWNASDGDPATETRRRPDGLRGYSSVSVRAATIHCAELRASSTSSTARGCS
jgi:hypothetical protein